MKKTLFISIVTILAGWLFLPIPSIGQIGTYNPISRLYICFDHNTCVHERGHKLDHKLGWPSQSSEFDDAVTGYITEQFADGNPSEYAIHVMNILMTRDDNPYRELYADIFMWADGNPENIPVNFQFFYSSNK